MDECQVSGRTGPRLQDSHGRAMGVGAVKAPFGRGFGGPAPRLPP